MWAALSASIALADGGPHTVSDNSGMNPTTGTCGGCHRAHTAKGANLINAASNTALCQTCHGSGGLGATTDVSNGVLAGTTQGLRGGGFSYALMDTSWTATAGNPATSRPATSAHVIDGLTDVTMWGNGALGTANAGTTVKLECTSCHNPHGNNSYRILRPIPIDSGATGGITVADGTGLAYTVARTNNRYFGDSYAGWPWTYSMTQWCAQCHTRYDAVNASADGMGGPGHTNSGDLLFPYRHMTRFENWTNCGVCHKGPGGTGRAPDPLGVGSSGFSHEPVCLSCHVAHGSAAQMGVSAGAVAWPNGATTPSGNARSSLLRLDNRGVCQGCHDPTK